jgi:hypothetical protein
MEPNPEHLPFLTKIQGSRVQIVRASVSDTPAVVAKFQASFDLRTLAVSTAVDERDPTAFYAPITTLRDASEHHGIDRVDVLRIRNGGNESAVLRGVPWERWRPRAIVCLLDMNEGRRTQAASDDLTTLLIERGYRLWVADTDSSRGERATEERFVDVPRGSVVDGSLIAVLPPLELPRGAEPGAD